MSTKSSKSRKSNGLLAQYLRESRRPLSCLAFTFPLLGLYEGGVLLLGLSAVRNGADVWLRQLLDGFGFGAYFLLPILAVAILLGWHHTTGQPWRLSAGVLYGMLVESATLGLVLMAIAHLQASFVASLENQTIVAASLRENVAGLTATIVSYFGAGIYEEMLFRLMLIPPILWLIAWLGGGRRAATVGAIAATSLCFAAAHYVGPHGDVLRWDTFVFRMIAGCFFAVLFVYRGFGVAAGAHAFYDIFVGV